MVFKQIETTIGRWWGLLATRRLAGERAVEIDANYQHVLRRLAELDQQTNVRRRTGA